MKDSYELLLAQFAVYVLKNNLLCRSTLKRYSSLINRFFQFLIVQEITFSHAQKQNVQEYVNDMLTRGCSTILIAENMTALRKFFFFAQQELGKTNITHDVELPAKPMPFIPTKKEVAVILNGAKDDPTISSRDRVILYLYFYHKMPPQSIAHLQVKDIDLERAAIFDQEKTLTMLMPGEWRLFLREYAKDHDAKTPFFFYSQSSSGTTFAMSPQSVSSITRTAANRFLNQPKQVQPETVRKTLRGNSIISPKFVALRKLYEKNHPRT